jgi:hypothetical protein
MKLTIGICIAAALAMAAFPASAQPREADVVVFDRQDFGGRLGTLDAARRDFGRTRMNDAIASMRIRRGTWEFCTEPGYRGQCRIYGPGEYRQLPSGEDDAYSSARPVAAREARRRDSRPPVYAAPPPVYAAPGTRGPPPGRGRIILFDATDYRGNSVVVDGRSAGAGQLGAIGQLRSIIIEGGNWRVCAGAHASGPGECQELVPGRYPNLPEALHGPLASVHLQ